jgi:enamine deaminase RidA (YjgF/YER057c/UK114 family)
VSAGGTGRNGREGKTRGAGEARGGRGEHREQGAAGEGKARRAKGAPAAPSPHQLLQPAGWSAPLGYANGVSGRGRCVFVAGQVGWEPKSEIFASDELALQVEQALANVVAVLRAGGAEPHHLVRMTWYVTDRAAYIDARAAIGAAYRAIIGRHFPAMSVVVVAGLLEPRAKVEIEATALVPE